MRFVISVVWSVSLLMAVLAETPKESNNPKTPAASETENFSSNATKTAASQSTEEKLKTACHLIIENREVSGELKDQEKIEAQLRSLFTQSEFSDSELAELIDDVLEIQKKYPMMMDCAARVEYVRKAVQLGIQPKNAVEIGSSEFIKLPEFVVNETIKKYEFFHMVSDIGCGISWKDQLKYQFVLSKYFKKGSPEDSYESLMAIEKLSHAASSKAFPKNVAQKQSAVKEKEIAKKSGDHVAHFSSELLKISEKRRKVYLQLIQEADTSCSQSFDHLRYVIAQDFHYGGLSKDDIIKIFEFSEQEWNDFIKLEDYPRDRSFKGEQHL